MNAAEEILNDVLNGTVEPPITQLSPGDRAILECLETCTAFGWMPSRDHVFRMIALRDEVRRGVRHEDGENAARMRYVKWLVEQGLISES
jgi:hypothetical protein